MISPIVRSAGNNSAERRDDATSFHVGRDDPPVRFVRIAAQWHRLFALVYQRAYPGQSERRHPRTGIATQGLKRAE
jgi:hypothetical protein